MLCRCIGIKSVPIGYSSASTFKRSGQGEWLMYFARYRWYHCSRKRRCAQYPSGGLYSTIFIKYRFSHLWINSSIGQCCFEVGPDVADVFDSSRSIPGNGDRHMLDLKSVVKDQLIEAGLANNNILVDNQCTFCEKDKYFSYRRDGDKAGRMVAIAGWSETSF